MFAMTVLRHALHADQQQFAFRALLVTFILLKNALNVLLTAPRAILRIALLA
jgi:hypothetical protein